MARSFFARLWLGPEAGDHAAALYLFQRNASFASFGLATVLLPMVTRARRNGTALPFRAVLMVAALFLAVAVPLIAAAVLMPDTLVHIAEGDSHARAAPLLWLACLSAIAFTACYLLAAFLAASGDIWGIGIIAVCVPCQIFARAVVKQQGSFAKLDDLLTVKVVCQGVLLAVIAMRLWRGARP